MTILSKAWHLWKRVGQAIGDLIGRIILTVFYFTVFAPFGLGVKLLSDPLFIRSNSKPLWFEHTTRDQTLDDGRRLS